MSSTVIPCPGYRAAPRMIDWPCETFGFERHAVDPKGYLRNIGTYDPWKTSS